jgi:hypothetical protein
VFAEGEIELGDGGLVGVQLRLLLHLVLHLLDDLPLVVEVLLLPREDRVPRESHADGQRVLPLVLAHPPRPLVVGLQLFHPHVVVGALLLKADRLDLLGGLLVEEVGLQPHPLLDACRGLLVVVVEIGRQVESLHRFAVLHWKNYKTISISHLTSCWIDTPAAGQNAPCFRHPSPFLPRHQLSALLHRQIMMRNHSEFVLELLAGDE